MTFWQTRYLMCHSEHSEESSSLFNLKYMLSLKTSMRYIDIHHAQFIYQTL
jgi:hypothetical protein